MQDRVLAIVIFRNTEYYVYIHGNEEVRVDIHSNHASLSILCSDTVIL